MIIKDKSVYLNYVKDIENKVNKLCAKVSFAKIQDPLKQKIEKTRAKILAKILLIKSLANQETGLIPNADWVRYKKEMDELYNSLSEAVQEPLVYNKPRANTR